MVSALILPPEKEERSMLVSGVGAAECHLGRRDPRQHGDWAGEGVGVVLQ